MASLAGDSLVAEEPSESSLLQVRRLRVDIRVSHARLRVVDDLTFKLAKGQTLALIGESGSGKSMSCLALIGLLPRNALVSGSIEFAGTELVGITERSYRPLRGRHIGIVLQNSEQSLNPTMRVGNQIAESILRHKSIGKKAATSQTLDLLQILRFAAPRRQFLSYPHELSGGMRQRIAVAMALAAEPSLLITDEATRSLDPPTQTAMMDLLTGVIDRMKMAHLFVSHDLRLASRYADDILVMHGGRPVEYAPTQMLMKCPRVPYSQALVTATPNHNRPIPLTLNAPTFVASDVSKEQVGCRFNSTCPHADGICKRDAPPWHDLGHDYGWACWHPKT